MNSSQQTQAASSRGRSFLEKFESETNMKRIKQALGNDIPLDRFTAVVMRAVQEDPDLLDADPTSLFLACQSAAADGLMPDKREGALVIYNENRGTRDNPDWVKVVRWQVMIGGIRKNLARHGFDLRAEVVRENDEFDYELGGKPWVKHKPGKLGTNRGPAIGAYAVATRFTDGREYIEVMDKNQLEEVRAVAKSGSVWNKWTDEMYRKSVGRRCCKQLPVGDMDQKFLSMLERDNEHFDLLEADKPSPARESVQKALTGGETTKLPEAKEPEPVRQPEPPEEPEYAESENPEPEQESGSEEEGFAGKSPGF